MSPEVSLINWSPIFILLLSSSGVSTSGDIGSPYRKSRMVRFTATAHLSFVVAHIFLRSYQTGSLTVLPVDSSVKSKPLPLVISSWSLALSSSIP